MSGQGSIKNRVLKQVVFYGIVLMLFVPILQSVFHLKKWSKPLDGAYYPEPDISFSWSNWFDGSYSAQKDKYLKENFGFRTYYVRLICQVNFSLFRKSNVAFVVVGKKDYLYETAYLDAYYGRDFIGGDSIAGFVKKIKKIQDTLQKLNKLMLVVYAPGKACFYPEYIPENYKTVKKITNYDAFITATKAAGIDHIDFYKYFQDQKNKSKYPLYPQLGIHWSNYGSTMALDSMIHYAENKLKVDLPDLKLSNLEVTDKIKHTDDDAIKSLNLYKNPSTFKMAYPNYEVVYDPSKHKKLSLLVVSDSFWWYVYSTFIPDKVFYPSRFWYYNEEIYPESYTSGLQVKQINNARKIREADVIILLHAEATLYKFGSGFVEDCYNTYFHPDPEKEKLMTMREIIRTTPDWFKAVTEKADRWKLPVDSVLTLDALYTLKEKEKR